MRTSLLHIKYKYICIVSREIEHFLGSVDLRSCHASRVRAGALRAARACRGSRVACGAITRVTVPDEPLTAGDTKAYHLGRASCTGRWCSAAGRRRRQWRLMIALWAHVAHRLQHPLTFAAVRVRRPRRHGQSLLQPHGTSRKKANAADCCSANDKQQRRRAAAATSTAASSSCSCGSAGS